MKYIKKNKWVLIPISVFVLVMIFAVVGIVNLVIPNDSKDLYGNRLENIEKNKISDDNVFLIEEQLLATGKVKSVSYDLKGKLINYILVVNDDVDKVTSQSLTAKILEGFEQNIKEYYDFQVFITTEQESEIYPIIGYKHFNSANFVWTNN